MYINKIEQIEIFEDEEIENAFILESKNVLFRNVAYVKKDNLSKKRQAKWRTEDKLKKDKWETDRHKGPRPDYSV